MDKRQIFLSVWASIQDGLRQPEFLESKPTPEQLQERVHQLSELDARMQAQYLQPFERDLFYLKCGFASSIVSLALAVAFAAHVVFIGSYALMTVVNGGLLVKIGDFLTNFRSSMTSQRGMLRNLEAQLAAVRSATRQSTHNEEPQAV